MDSNNTLSEFLSAFKTDVKSWVEIRMKLLQLHVFEKTSVVGSFLIYGVIIINLMFFALLFAFFALGFLIGKWVDSVAGGFAIVSCFYILILAIMLIFRKAIFTGLQNSLLNELNSEAEPEADKEKDDKEESLTSKE